MKRRQILLMIPMLLIATACATAGPPTIVSDACLNFRAITFAQLAKDKIDDIGNVADSDQTVAEISTHNAKYDSLCAPPVLDK